MAQYNNKLPCNKDLAMNNITELVLLFLCMPAAGGGGGVGVSALLDYAIITKISCDGSVQ